MMPPIARRAFTLVSAAAAVVLMVGSAMIAPAHAGSLTGDTINGSLTFCSLAGVGNVFTPTSGQAPVTFQYVDGSNTDTATFTGSQLKVEDQVVDMACGWGMTFNDATTPFSSIILVSDNFSPDLTYTLGPDGTISLEWAGVDSGPADYTAVFALEGVMEPATVPLLLVGLVGLGLARLRRRPSAMSPA